MDSNSKLVAAVALAAVAAWWSYGGGKGYSGEKHASVDLVYLHADY